MTEYRYGLLTVNVDKRYSITVSTTTARSHHSSDYLTHQECDIHIFTVNAMSGRHRPCNTKSKAQISNWPPNFAH